MNKFDIKNLLNINNTNGLTLTIKKFNYLKKFDYPI